MIELDQQFWLSRVVRCRSPLKYGRVSETFEIAKHEKNQEVCVSDHQLESPFDYELAHMGCRCTLSSQAV